MPTQDSVNTWIQLNVLDSTSWDNSMKKEVAVTQAIRNLNRWYPDVELTDEVVSLQTIWEIQGTDPALKYQKHGVKGVSDNGEGVSYGKRDKVAPEVKEILGQPLDERLDGGVLI